MYSYRDGVRGQRTELLHNIDQLTGPTGRRLFVDEDTFDNRYRAAIRSGRWKLLTGDPGILLTNTKHVKYYKYYSSVIIIDLKRSDAIN